MLYRLDLVLKPAEGALARVIGLAERRGFSPRAISGATAADAAAGRDSWRLQLVVSGDRPADNLRRQMEKIYDCESVEITALETTP